MFVQLIEGKVGDADGMRRQIDRWEAELQPGAQGYLGSTGGISQDGRAYLVARFESEDAARRNSDRPEQSAWWEETAKCFAGEPSFRESSDTKTLFDGGSDDAGFVQLMFVRADRAKLESFDDQGEDMLREARPDLLGGFRVWFGPDECLQVNYFTSEAEARQGEAAMESGDSAELNADFQSIMRDVTFADLRDPWLNSA